MRWFFGFAILLLGCTKPTAKIETATTTRIDSLLDFHITKLAGENARVTLHTVVDGVRQTQRHTDTDEDFWKQKLQPFRTMGVVFSAKEQTAYIQSTMKDSESNLNRTTWKATANQPLREFRMYTLPDGAILKMEAELSQKTFLTNEVRFLTLQFSSLGQNPALSRFSLVGTQQFLGMTENSFSLEGEVR